MIVTCAGLDQRTGEGFFHIEPTVGGWGAWEGSDGESGLINSVNAGMKDFPIEILETRIPLHVRRYGFRPDSGGAGKWRGGNGVVREFEVECDEAYVSLWWERSKTPAWGLFGGATATPPDLVINPGRADERHVLKATRLVLKRGDVIRGLERRRRRFRRPGGARSRARSGRHPRRAAQSGGGARALRRRRRRVVTAVTDAPASRPRADRAAARGGRRGRARRVHRDRRRVDRLPDGLQAAPARAALRRRRAGPRAAAASSCRSSTSARSRARPRRSSASSYDASSDGLPELAGLLDGARRVGVEEDHIVFARSAALAGRGLELAPAGGVASPTCAPARTRPRSRRCGARARSSSSRTRSRGTLLRPGISERELNVRIEGFLRDEGASASHSLVLFGENAANPHADPTERVLAVGDVVCADISACLDGYWGDLTRCATVGPPSDWAREVWALVRDAQAAAIAVCVPGRPARDVELARAGDPRDPARPRRGAPRCRACDRPRDPRAAVPRSAGSRPRLPPG